MVKKDLARADIPYETPEGIADFHAAGRAHAHQGIAPQRRHATRGDRIYQRGVRELLEKQFLYRSPSDGVFFVNIRFMFCGDRLAFVKSYYLKHASRQAELPLLEAVPIPVPTE